jgi:hypothetical protein
LFYTLMYTPLDTVRPQLTESAGETFEPQSESYSGQDIATCNHIQIPKQEIYCNGT